MSQTSVIGGALFLAFAIFIVVRGDLPCYLQVLGVATDAQCPIGDLTQSSAPATTTTTTITGGGGSSFLGGIGVGIGNRIGGIIGNDACNYFGLCDFGSFGGFDFNTF